MGKPADLQTCCMSQNTRFYAQKMAEQRAARGGNTLRKQLDEILKVVGQCEMRWERDSRR
jgi:hypothetical protein